jgi:hypothetical protein
MTPTYRVQIALALDEWQLRIAGDKPGTVNAEAGPGARPAGDRVVMIWQSPAVDRAMLAPGAAIEFHAGVQAWLVGEADLAMDGAAERAKRRAVADAAWNGPDCAACSLLGEAELIVDACHEPQIVRHVVSTLDPKSLEDLCEISSPHSIPHANSVHLSQEMPDGVGGSTAGSPA